MRRVFRIRTFTRWMHKQGLTDAALAQAVTEMESGLIDADLGGNLVKKRVALPGAGKRGGVRTIVATRMAGHWFFLFGFAKNERANMDRKELRFLQEVARDLLEMNDRQIQRAVSAGEMMEVLNDDDNI
jgi:hypothetical protein